ncbi:MAG: hypothetical protein JXR89_09025, partial [Deltaproteobacteria bacterium]|nr:hypothetical protein [Deltaproteobacteria bacterium]
MSRRLITQMVPMRGRQRAGKWWFFWGVGLSMVIGGLFSAGLVRATPLPEASVEPVLMVAEDGLLPIPLE